MADWRGGGVVRIARADVPDLTLVSVMATMNRPFRVVDRFHGSGSAADHVAERYHRAGWNI